MIRQIDRVIAMDFALSLEIYPLSRTHKPLQSLLRKGYLDSQAGPVEGLPVHANLSTYRTGRIAPDIIGTMESSRVRVGSVPQKSAFCHHRTFDVSESFA